MDDNFFSLIESRNSDRQTAFIIEPDGRTHTYDDMFKLTAQYANALVNLGVTPGERVAACVDKSVEAMLLYLGCLRVGAVYLPMNVGYTETEIDYFIFDAKPVVLICASNARNSLKKIAKAHGVKSLETLDDDGTGSFVKTVNNASKKFITVDRTGDDLAAILYTSGTTGRSKGAMITHRNLSSNATALVEYWCYSENDVLLHALPIFHVHGLFVATNITLMSGSSMIFLKGFDRDEVLTHIPSSTVMMGVPTFYVRMLSSEKLTKEYTGHMRLFISGSAPLSPEVHRQFEIKTGHAILERYGMTESGMVTSNPYDGERRPGTVGFPLPGIEIRIVDTKKGFELTPGDVGSIEIRGPNLFKGYWCMPEKTESEFRDDGFFISGDLGRIDREGYLNIVGREKDLIISGGYNVYPAEIENALDAYPGIFESAVIGLPHEDFGEGVTAIVVSKADTDLDGDQIRKSLSETLAKYKVPKKLIFVDTLPRNKMGKVQKAQLRDQYREAYAH